jgi:hypothetical protein
MLPGIGGALGLGCDRCKRDPFPVAGELETVATDFDSQLQAEIAPHSVLPGRTEATELLGPSASRFECIFDEGSEFGLPERCRAEGPFVPPGRVNLR